MRKDLVAAMKSRSAESVAALRTALAAIDNAEAVDPVHTTGDDDAPIASATAGIGSGDVARRVLTGADVQALLTGLIDEYGSEADRYDALNRSDAADQLRRQASALSRYL